MSVRSSELDWSRRLRTLLSEALRPPPFVEEKLPPGARRFHVVQTTVGFTFMVDDEVYRWDCSEVAFSTFSKERLAIPEGNVYCSCPRPTFRRLCENAREPDAAVRPLWVGPPQTTTIELEPVGEFVPTVQVPPVSVRIPPGQTRLRLLEPLGGSIGGALVERIESDVVVTTSRIAWLFVVAAGERQRNVRNDGEGVLRVWRWSDVSKIWTTDWT